jgi:DNA-directed RNA polymerase subunit F
MEPVLLVDVKDLLTEAASKRTLPREAQLALQHAEASVKLETKETASLRKALLELPFLDPLLAAKLTDMMPQWPEEVRLLASRDRAPLDETQVQAILDVTAKFR